MFFAHLEVSKPAALQVSENPERYVYGDEAVLLWLRGVLEERAPAGMPSDYGSDLLNRMPRWR